ncbi:hypothetical protein AC249_AIPGENE4993, partial [Exaiptasia diaphana]
VTVLVQMFSWERDFELNTPISSFGLLCVSLKPK